MTCKKYQRVIVPHNDQDCRNSYRISSVIFNEMIHNCLRFELVAKSTQSDPLLGLARLQVQLQCTKYCVLSYYVGTATDACFK